MQGDSLLETSYMQGFLGTGVAYLQDGLITAIFNQLLILDLRKAESKYGSANVTSVVVPGMEDPSHLIL